MMNLLNSLHHRDSSHLTTLRMTFQRGEFLLVVILSEAKDPYDEAFETIESKGFFAPIGAQNDIPERGIPARYHPERSEGSL